MNNASNLALVASNSGQPLTPKVVELDQRIATLELERSELPNQDPNQIERQIQEHTARAIVDPARFKPLLEDLINAKDLALQHLQRRATIDNELRGLRIERDAEIADQSRQELEAMNREFDAAAAEFNTLLRNMCRAYLRMHKINLRNASRNPRYARRSLTQFNFPSLNPHGWMANTSELVVDQVFPWLKEGS